MKTLFELIRSYIYESNEYGWHVSNRENMMLDRPGMEKPERDKYEKYLRSLGLMTPKEMNLSKNESFLKGYLQNLLMEVPLDDFEYVAKDPEDDVMVREEVADYFKAIPQSVNIYVAHTDDLSWAHRLPNEIQGKVSGFKSRAQVTLTDISNIGKLYPQIQRAMNPEGINLLYVYPKSFEVPAGGDTFIADVNPHYLAHDLHHMIENAPGRERGEKDAFSSLIKEYLMELVWLSYGGGSMEAEQVRNTLRKTGRRLGVANTDVLMSELFPGIKLPSGDFDLFGDVFADYLKNDGNLVLGVPEQLDYDGTVIELNPDSKHDQRAQQYEKKFKDLFDTVLDPLKGKVAMFNIFEVEHRELERARKQAEEKMQVDHGQLIDHIKAMGGEFKYFDESYQEEGVEELIFDTGLKPEKPVMGVEDFSQQFPKEAESIESLGYKITSAFDGFGSAPVEIKLKKANMEEGVLRKYVRHLLKEDAMGFVHQLAAGSVPEDFFGGKIDKQRGREIKQAFAKHADHQWLSTLDTVHWANSPYALKALAGKGKDELSATMALPGDPLRSIGAFVPYGLWIKGRITLASDTQDTIYSGFYGDYGVGHEGSEEEVAHRDKSSGRNKRPTMSKSYKNYGKLERGNEYMEKLARNIPYVIDQSTWNPNNPSSTNEALVDNWRPVGIVVSESDVVEAVKSASRKLVTGGQSAPSGNTAKDIDYFLVGAVKETFLTALELGVPIYNTSRDKLWDPGQDSITESLLRELVRSKIIAESRFKQMSKPRFTDLRSHLAGASFLGQDPEADLDDDGDWTSQAAVALRDDLNDYFDSRFGPGHLTAIVKTDMVPSSPAMGKDQVLKAATYYFEGGLHFLEVLLANLDDARKFSDIPGASQKIYEVVMHELLHMQQFLKFSKGDPTDEKWDQFMKEYKRRGGPSGMGEDYFFFDEKDAASELETFSFQIANELVSELGRDEAIESLRIRDLDSIKKSSSSYRDIDRKSDISRPEMIDMLKRAKQYAKRMR